MGNALFAGGHVASFTGG
ncbi:MAG TPA: hypothetical protein ENK23_08235 [Sorangium sp.]|nr:hypothetical protein [Sorangium sp.]